MPELSLDDFVTKPMHPTTERLVFPGIIALFDKAREKGARRPKIHLLCGAYLKTSPSTGNNPHSVDVYMGRYDRYVGRIHRDGNFWVKNTFDGHNLLCQEMDLLNKDPGGFAKLFYETTKEWHKKDKLAKPPAWCCFCGTEITRDSSKSVGYGPICAGKYGLPHPDNE